MGIIAVMTRDWKGGVTSGWKLISPRRDYLRSRKYLHWEVYHLFVQLFRSSRSQMFFKIDVLRNFTDLTRKHLCRSFLLKKLQCWYPETFLKRESKQMFSCEYCEIFKNSFVTEHLRWLLLTIIFRSWNSWNSNKRKTGDYLRRKTFRSRERQNCVLCLLLRLILGSSSNFIFNNERI